MLLPVALQNTRKYCPVLMFLCCHIQELLIHEVNRDFLTKPFLIPYRLALTINYTNKTWHLLKKNNRFCQE